MQTKAEKVITTIGSNITSVSGITDGGYYLLFNVGRNTYICENATTGRLDASSVAPSVNDSYNYIFQAHAEDGSKFSFSTCSGRYIPVAGQGGDYYVVSAANRDKVTISANGSNGNWLVTTSTSGVYWNGNPESFTGWYDNSGANSEYKIIPVTVVEKKYYNGVTAVPATKVTDLANLTSGYYMLKEVNTHKTSGWIKPAEEAVGQKLAKTATNPVADNITQGTYLWYVEKQDNGTYTISTVNKLASWPAPSRGEQSLTSYASKASLKIHSGSVTLGGKTATTTEGTFFLSTSSVSHFYHAKAGAMDSWEDANSESIAFVEFYPVDPAVLTSAPKQNFKVTYRYTMDGASGSRSKTQTVNAGEAITALPTLGYFNNISDNRPDAVNCDLCVNIKGTEATLPFIKTTNLDAPKWYAMLMHQNDKSDSFIKYTALSTNLEANSTYDAANFKENASSLLGEDGWWWCFTGNVIDGFQIYNKAAGVSAESATKKLAYGGNNPQVKENPANYTWFLSESNENHWSCFAKTDGNYMNKNNNTVAYWGAADNGSSIKFYTPMEMLNVNTNKLLSYINAPDGTVYGSTYVEAHRGELAKILHPDYQFDFTEAAALIPTVEAYNTSIAAEEFNLLQAGKYYRLYSPLYNKYIATTTSAPTVLYGNTSDENNAGTIVQFVADGDKYQLMTQGKYWGVITRSEATNLVDAEGSKGSYALTHSGANCRLQDQSSTNDANYRFVHVAASLGDKIVGWEASADASQWYIIPATDIEVTLNPVGNASYATVYLPFPVQGDGVTKLYTGVIEGNQLNMTAQDGVVPAKKGYVLCNTSKAASTTLTISSEAGSISGDNDLQGTLTGITFGESVLRSNYLVLGEGNTSHTIGFYTPSANLTAIGQNKAYLNASSVGTSANAIALNFDDVTTGISLTEMNGENAPVYDLSGRRVQRTVKGGLYIQNGKKYIVK
ncbi:MAG: hypothetical protein SPE09_04505 [Alloprevotella sp.]|nr:hypothetical protein [Alloprevotella sp.]